MSDGILTDLACEAGVATSWTDVFGRTHVVEPPTLRAVLSALDLPADTDADADASLARLKHAATRLPPLLTGIIGEPVHIPSQPARYALVLEDGRSFDGFSQPARRGSTIPPILEPGYHRLEHGGDQTRLAIAPRRCFTVPEALGTSRGWGLAVQLYALRRTGDAGIGDLEALAEFAGHAASHGAQALAISPLHAQFSADPDRFSPYAPSSRTAYNVLHSAIETEGVGEASGLESLDLVDWPAASRFRLERLRSMFEKSNNDPHQHEAFVAFRAQAGDAIKQHALFEALHAHFFSRDPSCWHWRTWPEAFRDPHTPAVAEFAREHAQEVDYHTYMQFLAERGLAAAQKAACDAGMRIGLIADLAVGTDSGGSQCWSRQQETLLGLTVGAPPDLLQQQGQNWGLTAFSPHGLAQNGFGTFRDMLKTAMANAGGMRIDHAMGLNRLWVIPEGATGKEGAYLSFPEQDLLRLVALESQRHRAIVLAEDLGTVPEGFSDRLRDAGIAGMRVLWFERDQNQNFTPPTHWTHRASAMSSTHDLPTVAGWWQGRDIDWREKLGQDGDRSADRAERARDRSLLWSAMIESGAASGPEPEDSAAAADAACAHVGSSACELVMLPVEDALALVEQPNLPGTLDEHPNWRRRLPGNAASLLDPPAVGARVKALDRARQQP